MSARRSAVMCRLSLALLALAVALTWLTPDDRDITVHQVALAISDASLRR